MLGWIKALGTIYNFISLIKTLIENVIEARRKKKEEENKKAVDEAVENKDQRELEEAIGSPNAGEPTKRREGVQERPRS